MKQYCAIGLLSAILFFACAKPVYRSQQFYTQNRQAIAQILATYDSLYARQPFNFGFTDHTHRHVVTEVKTDDMRYIFNTALFDFRLDTLLPHFQLDTAAMRRLALAMHRSGCLWLGRQVFYKDRKGYRVNYLSFGAATHPAPFSEQQYYVLGFPIDSWDPSWKASAYEKGKLVPIDDSVFFTISNRFK